MMAENIFEYIFGISISSYLLGVEMEPSAGLGTEQITGFQNQNGLRDFFQN
jgi:hypothetical protein